jgi:phosphoglycerate dehydrogenase-like enzyme
VIECLRVFARTTAVTAVDGHPEVLVTWPDYDAADPDLGGALTGAGCTLKLEPKRGAREASQMREIAQRSSGAIVSTDPFDADVLDACPHLRVIARVGVGVDSIDLVAASRLGVVVTITPGANESAVADHAIALMLAAIRRISEHDDAIRRGEWNRTGRHTPWELAGATVGLIGYGQIGRLVGERLSGFGVHLLFSDPVEQQAPAGATRVPLDTLLAKSDVVSVHTPLLPSTRGLLGRRELGLMRPDAVLINTARGGVVDEQALIEALEAGRLRAAALDVFDREPPQSSRLLTLRNVVLSPHVGGISDRSIFEMTRRATASVLDVLGGRTPSDVANSDALLHERFLSSRTAPAETLAEAAEGA